MPRRRNTTIGKNPLDAVAPPRPTPATELPARPRVAEASRATPPLPAIGRQVFEAWASGTERALRASFEAQTAALSAGLSVVDATTDISRAALDEWVAFGRQAQEAVLDAFRQVTCHRLR
jgi:hypothetical protein